MHAHDPSRVAQHAGEWHALALKYGDVGTAIGATAAVLAVVGTLVSRDKMICTAVAIVRAEIQMVTMIACKSVGSDVR